MAPQLNLRQDRDYSCKWLLLLDPVKGLRFIVLPELGNVWRSLVRLTPRRGWCTMVCGVGSGKDIVGVVRWYDNVRLSEHIENQFNSLSFLSFKAAKAGNEEAPGRLAALR